MPKAIWNDTVIAESDQCEVVEGNQYFPPDAVKMEYLTASDKRTTCFWKGTASYYNVEVDGNVNANGAWCYAEAKEKAKNIEGYIAFWQGVQVVV